MRRPGVTTVSTVETLTWQDDLEEAPAAIAVREVPIVADITGASAADVGPPQPPDDDELWSYARGTGRWFLQFSAFSKACLGGALFFLALRGDWLKLLMPFALMMVLGAVVSIIWSFQVKPFDTDRHRRLISSAHRHRGASVDVFITVCGEDPDVIRNTIFHARRLEHDGDVTVFVLDDKGSDEVRAHADDLGAVYVHRPNPGWMKKAGNIHHAYGESSGEFIIILDADFAARPDFLVHTLPYFENDGVGIVQTPQFFRVNTNNWVEAGAAAQQEQFYRIVQRARDTRGGAICVGTNAVYRRAALAERGGMALLEHSEDLFTGMKVIDAGFSVSYLPMVLAAGSAPDNTRALASQQYRWARGNFALAGTPLFKRLHLTFMQRLSIWDGWIFYVTSAVSPLVAVVVPILTLLEVPEAISFEPTLLLVPALLTEFVLQPRWLYMSDGPASRRAGLISQVAHLFALRDHLSDREQEWVPTGDTGGRRQATDRIPEMIAAGGLMCFLATITLVGVRVSDGYALVDLAPVVLLALIALPTALTVTNPPQRELSKAASGVLEGRDGFLDTVRGISIIRVMFWHALGFWWISWAFAAMPAVFYVSGALVAKSVRSKPLTTVVRGRLRRLLPPYAVFVAASLAAVLVAEPEVWRSHTVDMLSWVIPFQSPAPLPWEEGWLSTPLWFLRALILVLLLAPLFAKVAHKVRPTMWVMLWALTLIGLDMLIAQQSSVRSTAVLRGVGDVVLFGGFFALGMVGHHLRFEFAELYHRGRVLLLLVTVTALVTWLAPPADMVVNNSNVTMALVGLCWLSLVILFEEHFRHIGDIPGVNRLVGWVASNSMTVYLWHTAVLCVAFAVVGAWTSPSELLMLALVFVPLLGLATVALRPFEHHWSSTSAKYPLRALSMVAVLGVAALLVSQPTLFPKQTAQAGPPAPSARPETGDGSVAAADVDTTSGGVPGWMSGNRVASAATVALVPDRSSETGVRREVVEFGESPEADNEMLAGQVAVDPAEQFEVMSVTKTVTAAVALQLVDEGLLSLDDPLPAVQGLPVELTSELTLRRLLAHASGLVDYRAVEGFDTSSAPSAPQAVLSSFEQSDVTSTEVSYSSTNYFVVGMLIEQVTGQPLSEVFDERVFDPLGMDDTELVNNARAGFVGFSSGGVVSTLDDVATWYWALLSDRSVLGDDMLDEMVWGGAEFTPAGGLGAWRHCPCGPPTEDDAEPWLYLFHDGGDVRVTYHPDDDVVMVSRFSKPLYLNPPLAGDIDGYVLQVLGQVTQ